MSICDNVDCPFKKWCYKNAGDVSVSKEEIHLWTCVCPLYVERIKKMKGMQQRG